MNVSNAAIQPAVRTFIRSLLLVMAMVLGTAFLTTPAIAWTMHEAAHVGNPVAVDQHHDHDDATGTILQLNQDGPDDKKDDQGKGGHDHMPSLLAFLNATIDRGEDLRPPPPCSTLLESPEVGRFRDVRPPPLARPPRFL